MVYTNLYIYSSNVDFGCNFMNPNNIDKKIDTMGAVIVAALLGTKNFTIFEAQEYLETLLDEAKIEELGHIGWRSDWYDDNSDAKMTVTARIAQLKKEREKL